ncbi:MAG TPA: (Fe-S)-binding protein [Geminocystis sp. M7585_C2015_104]|nr:(Fe-S)-binding protein [Geminocystis sp. M7585_C2015_104]
MSINMENKTGEKLKSGFDGKNPPAQQIIDKCVHCGFCLSTCPSYRVIGKEMDSPRGRIYLMNAIHRGEAGIDETTTSHFDTCLGCLACVTTCPSGVEYDRLIGAMRPQIVRNYKRNWWDRLIRGFIFFLFPYPRRLGLLLPLLWLYQVSGLQAIVRGSGVLGFFPRLASMESILPRIRLSSLYRKYPYIIPAQGEKRYRVGVILGCVQRLFFSNVNEATIRVLAANGCEVVIPANQGCCGALLAHQGEELKAQSLARQMIDAFEEAEVDYVIINAAGCGHTLKEYDHILREDPDYKERAKGFVTKVRDIHEFLVEIGFDLSLRPISDKPVKVVYQDACHLLHGQRISLQPRDLLRKIPNVVLEEPVDAALCCGSAGVYNMLQPTVAEELGQQKVGNLLNTGAEIIASPNPGCALQIGKHLRIEGRGVKVFHPIELLDWALRGEVII